MAPVYEQKAALFKGPYVAVGVVGFHVYRHVITTLAPLTVYNSLRGATRAGDRPFLLDEVP